jgi:23S rRNA U2552 (ribose-2'-O)-methylase RlmE/FtsJ
MESLADIFTRIGHFGSDAGHNDKGSTHSYIETYERLMAPFREKCSFMEIGLAIGKSLELWGEYFGPESAIVGVDISVVFDTSRFDSRFNIIQADATKPEILNALGNRSFDIIIDDGSHMTGDQVATRNILMSRMNPGGLYIIEDILWLDQSRHEFEGAEIIDLRQVKGRWDDVLVIYRT